MPMDIDLYIPIFTILQFYFYMGLLKVETLVSDLFLHRFNYILRSKLLHTYFYMGLLKVKIFVSNIFLHGLMYIHTVKTSTNVHTSR
jgi:hypothetical protein